MLTIMAFVDGALDKGKVQAVLEYAAALGIDEPYIEEITEAARGEVNRARFGLCRSNDHRTIPYRVCLEDRGPWRGDTVPSALDMRASTSLSRNSSPRLSPAL